MVLLYNYYLFKKILQIIIHQVKKLYNYYLLSNKNILYRVIDKYISHFSFDNVLNK